MKGLIFKKLLPMEIAGNLFIGLHGHLLVMPENNAGAAGSAVLPGIDQTATSAAKWKVGDVVARSYAWIADVHYRKFLGITVDGGYLVQDFYESSQNKSGCPDSGDLPFTDPYVLNSVQEMLNGNADIYQFRSVSGDYTSWYDNGQKRQHAYFVKGNPQGLWEMWHANGQKSQEGQYQEGIPYGLWVQWYDNGNKLSEIEYADGVEHGCHCEWFRNGKKCVQGQSDMGQAVGKWIWWDDEGHVQRQIDHSVHGM